MPKCKQRRSLKVSHCKCGIDLKKMAHKVYWIEYYIGGRRRRERIGPSKSAAEQRLREVLKNRAEDRYIDRNMDVRTTFDNLAEWYLELPHIKAKKSYTRDVYSVRELKRRLGFA